MIGKLRQYHQHKVTSLIGSILINIALGSILTWGATNVYFISYFRRFDPSISLQSQSVIAFFMIPLCFAQVFSIRIAEKFGYSNIFYFCSFMIPGMGIIASYTKNFYVFFTFFVGLPSIFGIGLAMSPLLKNILYKFEKKGLISGILFSSFGVSALFYNIFCTYIVNPNNLKATIKVKEGENLMKYFNKAVTDNTPTMIFTMALSQFAFLFIGTILLKIENFDVVDEQQDLQQQEEEMQQRQQQHSSNNNEDQQSYEQKIEILNYNQNSTTSSIQFEKSPNNNALHNNPHIEQVQLNSKIYYSTNCPDIKTASYSQPFIILFAISFLQGLFNTFLIFNMKTYGLTIFNNDHFLTFLILINGITQTIGQFFWGFIFDFFKKGNRVYTFGIFVSTILSISFIYVVPLSLILFAVWTCILSFQDGGATSMNGPLLIQIFGNKIGMEMYAVKSMAYALSLMALFISSYFLLFYLTLNQIILIYSFGQLISLVLGLMLKSEYKWKHVYKNSSTSESLKINQNIKINKS